MIEYSDFEGKYCCCPICGSSDGIVAVVTIGVSISIDGSLEGDPEVIVGDDDQCVCNECGHEGDVAQFVSDDEFDESIHDPKTATDMLSTRPSFAKEEVPSNVVQLRHK
jgi:hypothetical protein